MKHNPSQQLSPQYPTAGTLPHLDWTDEISSCYLPYHRGTNRGHSLPLCLYTLLSLSSWPSGGQRARVCVHFSAREAIDFQRNLGLVRQQLIGLWPAHSWWGWGGGPWQVAGCCVKSERSLLFFHPTALFPHSYLFVLLFFCLTWLPLRPKIRYFLV